MKKVLVIFFTIVLLVITYLFFKNDELKIDDSKFTKIDLPKKFIESSYFSEYNLANKFVVYVDFSKSMTKRRLWVVDHGKVIATSYTSHGVGSMSSRFLPPTKFSNEEGSSKSSLGIYRILTIRNMNPPKTKHKCSCDEYETTNECSHLAKKFPLKGLESSNSNSLDRGIVIHTSRYVSENNCIGNSDGCFVVSPEVFEILQAKKMMFFKKCYLVAMK